MGNTCYMASILQCLLSSPELINYFLKREFKEGLEINSYKFIKQKEMEYYKYKDESEVNVTNEKIKIKNNNGLEIGLDSQMSFNVASTTGNIEHRAANSDINFKLTNSSGNRVTVLYLNSNKRVGIDNTDPDEALHVTGNIKTDNNLIVNQNIKSIMSINFMPNLSAIDNE